MDDPNLNAPQVLDALLGNEPIEIKDTQNRDFALNYARVHEDTFPRILLYDTEKTLRVRKEHSSIYIIDGLETGIWRDADKIMESATFIGIPEKIIQGLMDRDYTFHHIMDPHDYTQQRHSHPVRRIDEFIRLREKWDGPMFEACVVLDEINPATLK